MNRARISALEFNSLVAPLTGLKISNVWRGYGSAIFFELGELHEEPPPRGSRKTEPSLKGEYTIMIQWSWRVENLRSIEFGSWSTDRIITNRLQTLVNHSILGISLTGRLPEIQIDLTGNKWITSFHTNDGQPQWTLFLGDHWLRVLNGRVILEQPESD